MKDGSISIVKGQCDSAEKLPSALEFRVKKELCRGQKVATCQSLGKEFKVGKSILDLNIF